MSGFDGKTSNRYSTFMIGGIILAGALILFGYLMWYVSPDEITERVRVVAITESGCIVETMDGHAINIGKCQAQPDEYIMAPIDQKLKERANLMNPTT